MTTREEQVSLEAYRALYPDAVDAGGAVVLRAPLALDSPMLNRIVGIGGGRPATEQDVDEALDRMGADVTCYVSVSQWATPADLPAWLEARGLEPGWGWMLFRRTVGEPPPVVSELRLVEVATREQARSFGEVVAAGYGLPPTASAWAASAAERGWACWLALDGEEPAAAAALYVLDGTAYLGFAAALAEHRRKGAQNALLAARIERARELDCDLLVTETGELREGFPSNSYRNILRAGFEEIAVTANWLRAARPSG